MTKLSKHALRVADLPQSKPTRFELIPEAKDLLAIADELGLRGLRKLRFKGQITAEGKRDWRLDANLGATVIQDCVVTLEPVTTRIEESVTRRFLANLPEQAEEDDEIEMTEDDSIEPLGPEIDPATVMIEALALVLPLYPRAEGAVLGETIHTEPGKEALSDADLKPFAGLAALRDQLQNKED
ncbi:YceD family protein [Thalassovita sp.]|uniref:YceD family protein n=1 Tax=Thalassovita sp. TaxID=1979401 RepID=UPI003B5BEEB7